MLVNCTSFICPDVVLRLLERQRRWWNLGCSLPSDRWIMGNLSGSHASFVFPYYSSVLHTNWEPSRLCWNHENEAQATRPRPLLDTTSISLRSFHGCAKLMAANCFFIVVGQLFFPPIDFSYRLIVAIWYEIIEKHSGWFCHHQTSAIDVTFH